MICFAPTNHEFPCLPTDTPEAFNWQSPELNTSSHCQQTNHRHFAAQCLVAGWPVRLWIWSIHNALLRLPLNYGTAFRCIIISPGPGFLAHYDTLLLCNGLDGRRPVSLLTIVYRCLQSAQPNGWTFICLTAIGITTREFKSFPDRCTVLHPLLESPSVVPSC